MSPYEIGYHGFDPAKTRPMFQEALEVLVTGMTSARLTYRGEHYRYDDVPMELTPFNGPIRRSGTRRATSTASRGPPLRT